jgi:hypothetical protein
MGTSARLEKLKENVKKISKYFYWGIGLIVVGGITLILYNRMEKPISSILFFMGGFLMIYFYWIKWFKIPEQHPGWPPSISPCPDFLTLVMVPNAVAGTPPTPVCVDYVGISSNGRFQKSMPSDPVTGLPNGSDKTFIPNPPTSSSTSESTRLQLLCDKVRENGLTWTGVCTDV